MSAHEGGEERPQPPRERGRGGVCALRRGEKAEGRIEQDGETEKQKERRGSVAKERKWSEQVKQGKMFGGGAGGFGSAPVTKGLFACAATSVIIANGMSGGTAHGGSRSVVGSSMQQRSAFVSPAELMLAALQGDTSSRLDGASSSSSSSSSPFLSSLSTVFGSVPLSVLASQLAFTSVSELLAGAVLLYSAARHTERFGGTRRFAALCTLAGAASVAAQCCIAALAYSFAEPHSSLVLREVRLLLS